MASADGCVGSMDSYRPRMQARIQMMGQIIACIMHDAVRVFCFGIQRIGNVA